MRKLIITSVILMSTIVKAEIAGYYGKGFQGKLSASGYIYNMNDMTCASNVHEFGTVLKVTNRSNGKSVKVVVTDRGSFDRKYGRHIDLSKKAFSQLDVLGKGLLNVDIKVISTKNTFRYKHESPTFDIKEYL